MKSRYLYSCVVCGIFAAYFLFCKLFVGNINVSYAAIFLGVLLVGLLVNCATTEEAKAWSPKPDFDWSMHYFRAFAILNIVAVHYFSVFKYGTLKATVFQNATVYFLFISGYLCQYLDLKRSKPASVYYKTKLTNVISPYLIWTLVFFVFGIIDCSAHEASSMMSYGMSLKAFIKYVFLGRAQVQYWYIPFVAILFLVSPIILKMRNSMLIAVTILCGLLFFMFPARIVGFSIRPHHTFNLYCHFAVFYLVGFVYARYKVKVDPYLKRYLWLPIIIAGICFCELLLGDRMPLQLLHADALQSLEKLALSAVAIYMFDKIKNKRFAVLDLFAQYSFTIYFLHYYFLTEYKGVRDYLMGFMPNTHWSAVPCDIVLCCVYVLVLLLISVVMKKALGSRARMFIGA